MRESKQLEFKSQVTATFLKTVSAFANYNGGSILFGVDDNGYSVGLRDPVAACLDIENRVNESISPRPDYSLEINDADATVELRVEPGIAKPYLYKSKAYRRSDGSSVEVDSVELTRLVLEGRNLAFDRLPAKRQDLSFTVLSAAFKRAVGLKTFDSDTLKTLELFSDADGYNNAAAILADENPFPGIDMAHFGDSISIIRRRETYEGSSALDEFDAGIGFFRNVFLYEEVVGTTRRVVETIPLEAFREALANAIVHRTWDVEARIRVSMFDDRVEVSSPGGLPVGISEEDYLSDRVSIRRNPVIAYVFYRLGIIEAFGTGILRIKAAYENSLSKPSFAISENSIMVTLPVLQANLGLAADQRLVYDLLSAVRPMSSGEVAAQVDFGRTKLNRILKELVRTGFATPVGSGRGLKYRRVQP